MRIVISSVLWTTVAVAQFAPLPPAGSVALPLDEYNRLVELASKPVKKPDAAPLPFVLQRADLKLQVNGESATGTLELAGEVLASGPVKVPLVSGMTVFDAASLPV